MAKKEEKYKDLMTFEEYEKQPFIEVTGMVNAFVRPKEMLLQPVYGEDGMPKKVEAQGTDMMVGKKYAGKGETLDRRKYVKVFEELLPLIYSSKLSLPATKLLFFIMDKLKPESDVVMFSIKVAASRLGYKSDKSVHEGLVDLIKLGVIARKTDSMEQFWINPQYIFKGDRRKMLAKREWE